MTPGVVVDLGAGRALVGDRMLPVAPAAHGPAGALAVREAVIRPLRFGERLRLVADALDDARALAAAVLASACSTGPNPSPAERAAFEALALHLAGAHAGGDPVPGFATCAGLISRAYGWSADAVVDAEAAVVDRLALAVAGPPDDDGWTRIVLAPAPSASGADGDGVTSERVRDDLARDLLRRGAEPFTEVLPTTRAGSTARRGADPGDTGTTALSTPALDRATAPHTGPMHDHGLGHGVQDTAVQDHAVPDHAVPDHAVQDDAVPDHAAATTSPERRAPGAGPEPWPDVRTHGDRTATVPPVTRPAPTSRATAADDRAAPPAHPEHTLPPSRPAADERPWPEPIVTGPAWRPGSSPVLERTEASAPFFTRPPLRSVAARVAPPAAASTASTTAPLSGAPLSVTPSTGPWATPAPGTTGRAIGHAVALPAAAREATAAEVAAFADHLAALLDDEADLRGIRP